MKPARFQRWQDNSNLPLNRDRFPACGEVEQKSVDATRAVIRRCDCQRGGEMIQSLVTCLTALFNSQSTADPFGGSNKSHLLLWFGHGEGAGWNIYTHMLKKNASEVFTYHPIASRDRKERSTSTRSTWAEIVIKSQLFIPPLSVNPTWEML